MSTTHEHGRADLVAVIKEAIAASGLSLMELARRSGVSQPQLSRFMAGTRTLTLESGEKLLKALGLRVVAGGPPPPKKRRPKGGA
jgi:transcriptional regulator with XRE-family HTH domain